MGKERESGKAVEHPLALVRQITASARGLSATERAVLLGLALYLNTRDFTARPAQATLAADLDLSVRTVGRALIKLCSSGVLEVVAPGRGSRLQNGVRVGIVTTYRFSALIGAGYSATCDGLPPQVIGQIGASNGPKHAGVIRQNGASNAPTVADKGTQGTEGTERRARAREAGSFSDMKEGAKGQTPLPNVSPALAFKADWINSDRSVPGTLCTPHEVDELIGLGLVTRERARQVGLS